jgi:hypothetical protein
MARAIRPDTDWVEEFRKSFREPTPAHLARFRESLAEADRLRARLKIAPLTTGELVRSIRDEQDLAN